MWSIDGISFKNSARDLDDVVVSEQVISSN